MSLVKTSIPGSHEHPFAPFVRILGKGKKGSRSLTEEEAFAAMTMIMSGKVEDVQLGAFLMLLRVKEESAEELVGFVKAVRHSLQSPEGLHVDLDWSSYAGKRRHLPWYLLSVFLLANNGVSVFMHGANGHTIDRIYTRDVLAELDLPIATNWETVKQQLQQHRFAYFPLEHLCPSLHRIIELRNTLGLRSPVHTLSRLLNPLNAPFVAQGIFHPGYRPVHQMAAVELGYSNVAVIKGDGGEIEVNPDVDTLVQQVIDGQLEDENWPKRFAKRHVKEENLHVGHLKNVWRGEEQNEYGEAAIINTTAIILKLLKKAANQSDAIKLAESWWQQRDKNTLLSFS